MAISIIIVCILCIPVKGLSDQTHQLGYAASSSGLILPEKATSAIVYLANDAVLDIEGRNFSLALE